MAKLSDFVGGGGASLDRDFTAGGSGSAGDPVALDSNGEITVATSANGNQVNWVGVSNAAFAANNAVNVTLRGGLDINRSGLTIGRYYFLQSDGSVSDTASDYLYGWALTTNTIQMVEE